MRNVELSFRPLVSLLALMLSWALAVTSHAAQPLEGMVEAPCPPPLAMPADARRVLTDLFITPRTVQPRDLAALGRDPAFAPYERELRQRGAGDWPGLCRFRQANLDAAPGSADVVFIGDSITENWLLADPAFFTGGMVNRGIGAQTTAQMLVRFRADVLALRPKVVHILAGTNDVAGNNGPIAPDDFKRNIESMVELARAHDIQVVLGSIPPAATFLWRPAMRPAARIVELNRWLRDYAKERGLGYIDYHGALADADNGLAARFGNDGVHPNRDGYAVMRRLAEAHLPRRPWVAAWATAQQLAKHARAIPSPAVIPERLADQTVRMIARVTASGTAVRVSLSNSFGLDAVTLGAVTIARPGTDSGSVREDSLRAVTFGGRATVTLPPGAQITSDPVDLSIENQADVVVSLHVGRDGAPTTAHPLGLRAAWIAPGDQSRAAHLRDAASLRSYLWLSGIDVRATSDTAAIVAFGDSITDGYSTTPDADTPWPSILARRLAAVSGLAPRAVLNVGISGNRVLREGAGSSALARFDRDVLARNGVRWLLLLEGINDISFSAIPGLPASEKATFDDLLAGYRQLIARARAHGLRVIGGTLTPYEGVPTYNADGERLRQQVNQWIRTGGEFDAVVDFDAAVRDPQHPARLLPRFDSGDHIHPNDAGNEAMGAAIDPELFR